MAAPRSRWRAASAFSRTYASGSSPSRSRTATVPRSDGQVTTHSGWSDQTYRYDAIGRLTTVEDTAETICTRRSYGFTSRSNRQTLTTATAAPGLDCPTSGGTTTTSTYDSADRIIATGYTYDAFGRTTAAPSNGTIGYYTNDLAYQQTSGTTRQTWQLDAGLRFRSWKVETGSGSTWTQTQSKLNHYDSDSDNPRWITEDTVTGTLTRNVESASGDLAATTGKTGATILQLTTIHGDVALQLPLDTSKAPVALDSDEYGNPRAGQAATRYNWLGAKQRSTETLTGLTLMGVRLYSSTTGRFLSLDPVHGGNANAYEYVHGDPINNYDVDGKRCWNPWSESCRSKNNTVSYLYSVGSICFSWCPYAGVVGRTVRAYRHGKRAWHYGRAAWRIHKRVGTRGLWNHSKSWAQRQGCVRNAGGFGACAWLAVGGVTGITEGWGHAKNVWKLGRGKYRAIRSGRWWR